MGKSDALSRRVDHGSGSDDNRDITLLTPNFFAVRALEGLELEGQERELLKLIWKETRDGELDDVVSKAVKALKSTSAKSIRFRMVRSGRGTPFPGEDLCPTSL